MLNYNHKLKEFARNLVVLYVEDNAELRDRTQTLLNNIFTKVDIAIDGSDAIEKYEKYNKTNQRYYDLVITDINMPKINGIEMSKKIKSLNTKQYIIIISAHDEIEYLHDSIEYGIDAYLNKPIQLKPLLDTLFKAVESIYNRTMAEDFQKTLQIKVKQQEEKLKKLYLIDNLTELKNVNAYISVKDTYINPIVSIVDINKLFEINNFFGINIGNNILIKLAGILINFFDNIADVYRGHNDEFIIATDIKRISYNKFKKKTDSLLNYILTHKFDSFNEKDEEISINVQVTIGTSQTKENTYLNANRALHQAKSEHRRYILFDDKQIDSKNYEKNFNITKEIISAIENNRIITYYQPIVDNSTKKIVKYETLVRLMQSDSSILTPNNFLEESKNARLYEFISQEVFRQAFTTFKDRKESFSINIDIDDILNHTTNNLLMELISSFKDKNRIVLELTETELIEQSTTVREFLMNIKNHGCKLSIDDFGSGYSNFQYLLEMEPDIIKIDGSIVKEINKNNKHLAIVESITSFASKVGIDTIAEFVANEDIFNVVNSLGITYSQGYYFGKPSLELQGI